MLLRFRDAGDRKERHPLAGGDHPEQRQYVVQSRPAHTRDEAPVLFTDREQYPLVARPLSGAIVQEGLVGERRQRERLFAQAVAGRYDEDESVASRVRWANRASTTMPRARAWKAT